METLHSSIHERIDWLVKTRFDGNRAKLAAAIGYTRAMIGNVVRDHVPGRKMIEAIVEKLKVDRGWLLDGKGHPFKPSSQLLGPPRSDQFKCAAYDPNRTDIWLPLRYSELETSTRDPVYRCRNCNAVFISASGLDPELAIRT